MGILSRFYEDIEPGQHFEFGSRLFDAECIKDFAARYDPQRFHMDEEAAKDTHFGALCASGWQTLSCWMRLHVDYNMSRRQALAARGEPVPELGPSPGVERIEWKRPVHAGDEISCSQTVTAKRPLKSRTGWGLVFSDNLGRNGKGEPVLFFVGKNFVPMRS